MPPILHDHALPTDARWLRPARLRAALGFASNLKASTLTGLPLWVRARNTRGVATWVPLSPRATQNPSTPTVCDGHWAPDQTGLWLLDLAVETAPGHAALVPGQVLHALVENERFSNLHSYTIIPRVSGELATWSLRLAEIKRMGFNAVWLLPISQTGVSQSPYSASDPMAVDAALAPNGHGWKEARAFADACASEGLALGVDLVMNHVAPEGQLAKQHPEWLAFNTEERDGLARSGWRSANGGPFHAWRDLVRLQLDDQSMGDRRDMLDYWTGYALEWTRLSARSAAPMVRLDNAHSTPEVLLEPVLQALRADQPQLSVLGEFFNDTPGAADAWVWRHGIERLLATPWTDPFAPQERHLLQFLDQVAEKTMTRHFVPLCSPDSPSAAEAYGGPVALGARYATLAILGGGCTGMMQGTEWSTPKKIEFIGPPGPYEKGESQHEVIRQIHAIAQREGPFGNTATAWLDGDDGAIIGGLRIGRNGTLLVAANLDASKPHTLHLRVMAGNTLTESYARGCRRDGADLVLEPGGFGIFKL